MYKINRKNSLVSIIVPVYNAENYLSKCINSIVNQTYKNIELILINDGSSDNSQEICDRFALMDKRIKIINQENKGPSMARNIGLKYSSGQYIQFVDSDDVLELNMTERLINTVTKDLELVVCGYKNLKHNKVDSNIQFRTPPITGVYQASYFMQQFGLLHAKGFLNTLWNKLYLKSIIEENRISFTDGMHIGEDLKFNIDYIKNIKGDVAIIKDCLYNYIQYNNESSLTKIYKENYFENRKTILKELKQLLDYKNSYSHENKKIIEQHYTLYFFNVFNNIFHKESPLTLKMKTDEITNIVNDEWTQKNISNFRTDSWQRKLVVFLIKRKYITSLFILFFIKNSINNPLNKS